MSSNVTPETSNESSSSKKDPVYEQPAVPPSGQEPTNSREAMIFELVKNYIHSSVITGAESQIPEIDPEIVSGKFQDLRERVIDGFYGVYERDEGQDQWARNVLVIGAGASRDSFWDIPMASKVIKQIEDALKFDRIIGKNPKDKAHIKHQNDKLRIRLHQPDLYLDWDSKDDSEKNGEDPQNKREDFETTLGLLLNYYELSDVREEIRKIYNKRFGPTLFYEIVAHLFKHQFFDIIINFNFDELLDQAIEEELGKGNYHYIISDGDCESIDALMVDERLKTPIYIKPHGTASHKSSLRFTKSDYFELPFDIKNLLEKLLGANIYEDKDETFIQRVNLFSVGFAFNSLEFNDIITRKLPSHSQIFFFQRAGSDRAKKYKRHFEKIKFAASQYPASIAPNEPSLIETGNAQEKKALHVHLIEFDASISPGLDAEFKQLWSDISKQFSEYFKPRGIERHELIEFLFGPKHMSSIIEKDTKKHEKKKTIKVFEKPIDYYQDWEHLLDRTVIEILMALAKGNRHIDPHDTFQERLGYFFPAYQKRFQKVRNKEKRGRTNRTLLSLHQICTQLKLDEQKKSFSRNVIFSPNKDFVNILMTEARKPNGETLLSRWFRNRLKAASKTELKKLTSWFDLLLASDTTQIMSNFHDPQFFLFDRPIEGRVLNTKLALTYHTWKAWQKDWNVLFVVCEQGYMVRKFAQSDWAKEILKKNPNRKICIITAQINRKILQSIEDVFGDNLILGYQSKIGVKDETTAPIKKGKRLFKVNQIPYWMHRHHMMVFLRLDGPKREDQHFKQAIYFEKDGLSTGINPMRLEKYEETPELKLSEREQKFANNEYRMILETFFVYIANSQLYSEPEKEGQCGMPVKKLLHIKGMNTNYVTDRLSKFYKGYFSKEEEGWV